METIILQFQSIIDLVDFQMMTKTDQFFINYGSLTLAGNFKEKDIALAKAEYKAIQIDTVDV